MKATILWHLDAIKDAVESIEQDKAPHFRAAETLLPPEITWTLLGLLEYQRRKTWAWKTVKERLPHLIPGLKISSEKGDVPGLPGWRYKEDGNASYLVHRDTRERIHFDALNGRRWMYSCLFEQYIREHRAPGPATARLKQFFPDARGLTPALNYLCNGEILRIDGREEPEYFDFELDEILRPFASCMGRFLATWQEKIDLRLTLARAIGDWSIVAEHETGVEREKALKLAKLSRKTWLSLVLWELHGELSWDALYSLRNSKADDLADQLDWAKDIPRLGPYAEKLLAEGRD